MKKLIFVLLLCSPALYASARFGKCTQKEIDAGCYITIDAWCDPWNPNDSCVYQCVCEAPRTYTENLPETL